MTILQMNTGGKFTQGVSLIIVLILISAYILFPKNNSVISVYAQQTVMPGLNNDIFASKAGTNQSLEGHGNAPYLGVNIRGYYTSMPQAREGFKQSFPSNYYENSFKIFSQTKIIDHVRFRFYWESYERDPIAFLEELEVVASTADKYGINVIYDNHQFRTSSWLSVGQGTGFPTYLFNDPLLYQQGSGGAVKYSAAETWWTKWWDRSVKSTNGTDGWTLQAEFLKKVVATVDKHRSTLGYEILSEPQIHTKDQWTKIGAFNSFITDELRKITNKTLIYSVNLPLDMKDATQLDALNIGKMAPLHKKNVVFKMNMYGSPSTGYHNEKLKLYLNASRIAGVPLYVGEWNYVKRIPTLNEGKKIWRVDMNKSDISQSEANNIVAKFKELGIWGMAYWDWSFVPNRIPNFNLVNIAYDSLTGESTIQPTKYFQIMKNSYKHAYGY